MNEPLRVETVAALEPIRIAELLEIYDSCFSGPPRFEHFDRALIQRIFDDFSRNGATFVLATDSNDRLCGYAVSVRLSQSQVFADLLAHGADPSSRYLEHLAVRPGFQDQGLGRRLLRSAIESADDATSLVVRCRSDIPNMLRLLTSEGFRVFGSYDAAVGGSTATRLLLMKDLKN